MFKLYKISVLPQLTTLFNSTTYDSKNAYLLSLSAGAAEKDLSKCLSIHTTGAGYAFDKTKISGICTILGEATTMTRQIVGETITFSATNIVCSAEGRPTHLVLGGIVPVVMSIGGDVSVLYPESSTQVDITTEGSVVYIPPFSISLGGLI